MLRSYKNHMIPKYLRCILSTRCDVQCKGKAWATQTTIVSKSSDWAAKEKNKTLRSTQALVEIFYFDLTKEELKKYGQNENISIAEHVFSKLKKKNQWKIPKALPGWLISDGGKSSKQCSSWPRSVQRCQCQAPQWPQVFSSRGERTEARHLVPASELSTGQAVACRGLAIIV